MFMAMASLQKYHSTKSSHHSKDGTLHTKSHSPRSCIICPLVVQSLHHHNRMMQIECLQRFYSITNPFVHDFNRVTETIAHAFVECALLFGAKRACVSSLRNSYLFPFKNWIFVNMYFGQR